MHAAGDEEFDAWQAPAPLPALFYRPNLISGPHGERQAAAPSPTIGFIALRIDGADDLDFDR